MTISQVYTNPGSVATAYFNRVLRLDNWKIFLGIFVIFLDLASGGIYYATSGTQTTNIYFATVLSGVFALYAILKPRKAFFLMMILIANTHYFRLGPVKLAEVLALSLFLSLFIRGKLVNIVRFRPLIIFLLFIAIGCISVMFMPETPLEGLAGRSSPMTAAVMSIGRLIAMFLMIWTVLSFIQKQEDFFLGLQGLALGFFINASYILFQYSVYLLSGRTVEYGRIAIEEFPRATGVTSDPGAITLYINLAIFTCLALGESRFPKRIFFISRKLTLYLLFICQVVTFSVVGWAGLLVGLVVYYFNKIKRILSFALKGILVLSMCFILFITFGSMESADRLVNRFSGKISGEVLKLYEEEDTGSAYGIRALYDYVYLRAYADNPLLGIGAGQGGYYLEDYARQATTEGAWWHVSRDRTIQPGMNYFVIVLGETGIAGFFFFLLFFLSLAYKLSLQSVHKELVYFKRGLLAILVTVIFGTYASNAFFIPYFSVFMAYALSLQSLSYSNWRAEMISAQQQRQFSS